MIKRIFLVGFRTTGKTTIGKILADKLNWSFLDTDFLISQQANENIQTLTKNGSDWDKFREIENETLGEVSTIDNVVISCGGGVGVNDILEKNTKQTYGELNKKIINDSKDSLVVLLTSDEKNIRQRLKRQYKNKKIMPFLNTSNAKQSEEEVNEDVLIDKQIEDSIQALQKRKPLYDKLTDIKINSDSQSLKKTAEEIINYVK